VEHLSGRRRISVIFGNMRARPPRILTVAALGWFTRSSPAAGRFEENLEFRYPAVVSP